MPSPPEISLPRAAFYLTLIFSVLWISGAQVVMTTEIDPLGREVSAIENSIWIQQQQAKESQDATAVQKPVVLAASSH